jgi:uncharacterized integral membrane protein
MRGSQFPQAKNVNKSSKIPVFQLAFTGLVITGLAAIFVQNLQPTVQLVFLGQMTIAVPLSMTMLAAFTIGGILAFTFNSITSWRQNLLIRRALVEPRGSDIPSSPRSTTEPVTQSSSKEYEEEYYEDDSDEEFEDDDQDYEEEDPDTLPYGDRFKKKSSVEPKDSNQNKGDRPPLNAKYIN